MHHRPTVLATLLMLVAAFSLPVHGQSIYRTAPEDPAAVYLTREAFGARADGEHDDTAALQAAINRVEADRGGVLFIPSGTYRLSQTVYIWPGVRLIGYGETRPVFKLAADTPGFQSGDDAYMLYFSGGRGRNAGDPPRDANPGTFYSGISNIDIDIEPGNPAALGVRFHVAQHCSVEHMHMQLGDARAGLVDIGNLIEDVHFVGGTYAIDSSKSSPGWPIAVIDCTFESQRTAAILTREAGLAIVRPTVRDTPAAVVMERGVPDELWISDGRFENISGPAIVISRPTSARTQVALEQIACENVPTLTMLRGSGEVTTAPGPRYVVDHYTRGLHLGSEASQREITTKAEIRAVDALPDAVATDVASLPESNTWVNVRTFGVIGDGKADDTRAIQAAIDSHRVLYFPMGWYNISDTLTLRDDTVLIALHPAHTVINLPNDTAAFAGDGPSKPMVTTLPGGTNIVTGLGIFTGERNPRAVAMKWQAGERSLLDDVRFHGGHGTHIPGQPHNRYGDREHWNTQPTSLWVTNGGGGVLKNIWTPNPHARSGMHIEDTATPGRLYVMSVEHHVDHEVIIEHAQDWEFFALQFEEEREEGPKALPLEIESSRDLLFVNTFFYRVISSFVPAPHAITVADSEDIRFRNVHVFSNSKVSFDSAVFDAHSETEVRDPEFAVLDLPSAAPPVLAETGHSASVAKLADGFLNIAGMAVAPNGDVYFADARANGVYRWSHDHERIEHVRDIPERPEQLAFDRDGNLLVVAYEGDGTVFAFDPQKAESPLQRLSAQPAETREHGTPIFPVGYWGGDASFLEHATAKAQAHYVAPDGQTFIAADELFTTGGTSWGIKHSPLLRSFSLASARPGQPFYASNELDLRTYAFDVRPDGSLANPRLFVEEGGEGVTTDADGNVYIAAGQIFVFNPEGERIGVINMPQRPTGLVFGGPRGRTLYVTARDALYAVSFDE